MPDARDPLQGGLARDLAKFLVKVQKERRLRLVRRIEDRLRKAMPISTTPPSSPMGAAAVVPNSADDPTALECAYCSQESNSSSAADAARPRDRAENNSSSAADAARPCDRAENPNALECILCLDAYETGQRVRTLPCDHVFHQHCIDRWLFENCSPEKRVCPVCRGDPLKMQMSATARRAPFGSRAKAIIGLLAPCSRMTSEARRSTNVDGRAG